MAARRRATAREFILRHAELDPEALVRVAAAHGFEITPKLVAAVRYFSAPDAAPPPPSAKPPVEPPPRSERRVSAKAERRLLELAGEIGYARARELLELVDRLLQDGQLGKSDDRDAG